MKEDNEFHHVAWADRLGLNKQWSKDIENCSATIGTNRYVESVKRFKLNIVNIKNGPQLKTIINNFIEDKLEDMKYNQLMYFKENYPEHANDDAYLRRKIEDIDMWAWEKLYEYMVQLLEDNGFCFYESNIVEDEMR